MMLSIIIPAYNSEHYLAQTITSLLAQTYIIENPTEWELLVINDCSDNLADTTDEIVTKYTSTDPRISYIKNETNLGISKTRNKGIALARGKYIAMLDSDDIWLDPTKLTQQVAALEASPKLGVIGTYMIKIDEDSNEISDKINGGKISFGQTDAEIRASELYRNHIMQSSVVFRKSAATTDVTATTRNPYDETLITMEDHDLWLKIGTTHEFAVLPIFALGYRIREGGITKSRAFRVALDEINVIWRHRREYPGFVIGITKGLARLALSLF